LISYPKSSANHSAITPHKKRPFLMARKAAATDELMTSVEAAKVLAVSGEKLAQMRLHGAGPTYFKMGSGRLWKVVYRRSDLMAYLETKKSKGKARDRSRPISASQRRASAQTDGLRSNSNHTVAPTRSAVPTKARRESPLVTLLTTSELAQWLRLSPRTLEDMRFKGTGPKYIKQGTGRGKVVYARSDVLAWLEAHTVDPES